MYLHDFVNVSIKIQKVYSNILNYVYFLMKKKSFFIYVDSNTTWVDKKVVK